MSDDHKHEHGACCGGHDHEPAQEARVLNTDVKANNQTTLRVAGMDCPDEIAAIERALKPLAGVGEIKVNLMAGMT
jgi:Cd2+/Zn2+-exporting ATPase